MPLQLAHVPRILEHLGFSPEQQGKVMDYVKLNGGGAGNAAVSMTATSEGRANLGVSEPISEPMLKDKLLEQSFMKSSAISVDINRLVKTKTTQDTPPWLQPNWGNKGVHAPSPNPTRDDAASTLVNMAQNMLLLANKKPEMADSLKAPIDAANFLAMAVATDNTHTLNPTLLNAKLSEVNQGLYSAVAQSGEKPRDARGNELTDEEFKQSVTNRMTEAVAVMNAQIEAKQPPRRASAGWSR